MSIFIRVYSDDSIDLHIKGKSIDVADDCFIVQLSEDDLDELTVNIARALAVINE